MGFVTPAIIARGGKDLDGSWGEGKTFVRETYYILENVPLPLFMISPLIPVYNSFHPLYPFALAQDSKISCNILKDGGQGITVSTTYKVLKPNVSLTGLSGWDVASVINNNLPHLLPAQDVKYTAVSVTETLYHLYQLKDDKDDEWESVPFQTTAGTTLTGTTTRNISKMSFWYFVSPDLFDEETLLTKYTGVVNDAPVTIAGRSCPTGTVKIESIEVSNNTWERPEVATYSVKLVKVVLLLDDQTWNTRYENVSNLFMAYPYEWEDSDSGKEKIKMKIDPETHQPAYRTHKRHQLLPSLEFVYLKAHDRWVGNT